MPDRIFKSDEARARMEDWYKRFLDRVKAPLEHREVPTAHGTSHVLVVGEVSRPPLVLLHGALAGSAHAAVEMGPLAERFRVYLPDLPGQSVRGPQVRLPLKDDSFAQWLLEVLNKLGLEEFDLFGVSWGGFVALQTARVAPRRVKRLVLLVPAGIVSGSVWAGLTRVAFPMMMYRLFGSQRWLGRFYDSVFTTRDDLWLPYFGDAVRDVVLDFRAPPLAKPEALKDFKNPALIIGAGDDVHFPGGKLVARAKELLPQAETELIPDCKHAPPSTDEFRRWLADRVTQFLGEKRV